MSGKYLTDLADVLRDAGLEVVEYAGWKTRARSTGGFAPDQPCAIVVHHTASPKSWDGKRDADFIAVDSSIAPIAQLYLDRTAKVWVLAAGAANNAGKGGPKGPIHQDGANIRTIGIEAGNDGLGEPWTEAQQAAYVKICAALCKAYNIAVDRVWGHFEWAPARRIDPAGQSKYATGKATWNMAKFRDDVSAAVHQPPPPNKDDNVKQGEAYDTLTLFYVANFPEVAGTIAPSKEPGREITTQQDLYDVLTLWHAVNPALSDKLNAKTPPPVDGSALVAEDVQALYRQVDSMSSWFGLVVEAERVLSGNDQPAVVPRPPEAVTAGPLAGISENVATQLQTMAAHVTHVTKPLCVMNGVAEPKGTLYVDEKGSHYEPQPWW